MDRTRDTEKANILTKMEVSTTVTGTATRCSVAELSTITTSLSNTTGNGKMICSKDEVYSTERHVIGSNTKESSRQAKWRATARCCSTTAIPIQDLSRQTGLMAEVGWSRGKELPKLACGIMAKC